MNYKEKKDLIKKAYIKYANKGRVLLSNQEQFNLMNNELSELKLDEIIKSINPLFYNLYIKYTICKAINTLVGLLVSVTTNSLLLLVFVCKGADC